MNTTNHRVWMIGWEYPPHNSGGLGVACQGLTQALAAAQTQIYFTLPYHLGQTVSHMKVIDCVDPGWSQPVNQPPWSVYHTHPSSTSIPSFPHALNPAIFSTMPTSELERKVNQYASIVTKAALGHQAQVIHAHDWMALPSAARVKSQTGWPVVAHVHSTEVDRIPGAEGSAYITHIEQVGWQQADQVIAVSAYTKKILVDHYGIAADKIQVVHNGINPLQPQPPLDRPSFAGHRPVVVFMGRLTDQKGPFQFLDLAKRLVVARPEVLLIVAGSGDLYHQLLWSTASQGLSTHVLFTGFIRDQWRDQLLDRADVFVMPSLSEPFGLVALEAAARHTPVIVSKTAGVAEALKTAIQIDFWDTQQMTAAIIKLLDQPEYRQQIVAGQLRESSQLTWDKAATKVMAVYRRAFLGG